jgi:hypothetical protein
MPFTDSSGSSSFPIFRLNNTIFSLIYTMQTTRAQHLEWAKDRALAYLQPRQNNWLGWLYQRIRHATVPLAEADQVIDAWNSFVSDMGKHPQTTAHASIMVGAVRLASGQLSTVEAMRAYIQGFI